MRAFLETYGIAIFTLIIVSIMVLMAGGTGDYIQGLLKESVENFTINSSEQTDKVFEETEEETVETEINEFGFHFDQKYVTEYDDEGIRDCYVFKRNGELYISKETNEEHYDYWCEKLEVSPGITLEELNKSINLEKFYSEFGVIMDVTYDKEAAEDEWCSYSFSNDGKTLNIDEGGNTSEAKLIKG